MSPRAYPALTCAEVRAILKALGFKYRESRGSHDQWTKDVVHKERTSRRKVTVDCPKAPFGAYLLQAMIAQSGHTRKEFYNATKATAKKIR